MPLNMTRGLLIAGVATVAFTGCLQESGIAPSHAGTAASTAAASVATVPAQSAGRLALPDFSGLVEQVGPAVVNISVSSVDRSRAVRPQLDENDPFYEFFRRFGIPGMPGAPGGQGGQPRVQQGVGSGFIISADGYALTNAHVVDGADDIMVRLTDKREFKAKLIGLDKRTDVALIKLDATGLPTVKIGDPVRAKAGQWVVAVGSPFGLESTVTAGIISSKARRLEGESFVDYIQTDVAINPGNSGGPLLNLDGEVIGINSQIYSRSGGYMGISFAIPIDTAMKVREQLQQFGKVQRGKLGVGIQGMDKDMALALGLEKPMGALVREVEPGSPADKAGILAGDVVLQVDATKVDEVGDLSRIIGNQRPGDTVKLKVWRDKKSRDISVKLAEMSSEVASTTEEEPKAAGGKLGLTVRPLTSSEASRLNVPGGLFVEEATGAGAQAGLRTGDVILSANNVRVDSVESLRRATESGNRHMLLVQRGNSRQFVVLRVN